MIFSVPPLLFLLSLLNIAAIHVARQAILAGDWFRHRNFMLVALGLWGLTLILFAGFFLLLGVHLPVAARIFQIIYLFAALAVSALLGLVLLRVKTHQLLPHKILARRVWPLWTLVCCGGVLVFFYIMRMIEMFKPIGIGS